MSRIPIILLLFFSAVAYSQQTAIYHDPEKSFQVGLELFNKQKYVAAQTEFGNIISTAKPVSEAARADASFYFARCAEELFHPDAEFLFTEFIEEYPESPHYQEAVIELGNFYYRQKQYKKVIAWVTKVDRSSLTSEQRDEMAFKMGYSYFMTNDYENASKEFSSVKDGDSKYANAARYFCAHIAYVNQNYATALQDFLKLKESEAFAQVVPYYITQIYYKQGKYDELLGYAPNAMDSAGARNGLEISRMVAESHYRKGSYVDALPYLLDYERNSPNASRMDSYQIGYCYYMTGNTENGIRYFQKVVGPEDSLAQNAYYHLAGIYLKAGNKRSARLAFQSAAKMEFDPDIREQSQFNYAKLSYELSFQSVALEAFQNFIKNYPESSRAAEANEFMIAIYANTHNYRDAMTAIESIAVKSPSIKAAYQKVAYYRGIEFFMDNKPVDAVRVFNISLANPVDQRLVALANYWKGEAQYKNGSYAEAVRAYNDFLYTPSAVNMEYYNLANYNTGYANFKIENYGEAQSAFRKYIKDKTATDVTRYNDALLRVADCAFMQHDQVNALDYYNQAIAAKAAASDYAIFQKAVITGIQGNMSEKVRILQQLFDKYPASLYYDDALYEAGQASLMLNRNDQALVYYRKIITNFPSGSYVKKAELGEAIVYYNNKEDEKAINAYKRIVEKYPNTNESREALAQIKNIAVNQGHPEVYLDYVKNVPNADVSAAAQDSLTYEAAELRYTQGNCDDAVKDFENYLKRFPNALFQINASYYKSDCMFRNKQFDRALEGYLFVMKQPRNQFTEKSCLNASLIQFRQKDFTNALSNFETLESIAEVKENILAAQAGQMRCNYLLGNYDAALADAQKILESSVADKDLINESHLVAARVYLSKEELAAAKSEFAIVAKRTNSEMTAESKYFLAYIEYKLGNYKESQKMVFEIQKLVPSYDYWIARGFILLGDNYLAQRDTFQAKETYKSIVDNYSKDATDPDDLKVIAQEKLAGITAKETIQNNELMEQKLRNAPIEPDSSEVN